MSPTSVNLVEDHGFIREEYYLHWYETFWKTQNKSMRAYARGQYHHIIVENWV